MYCLYKRQCQAAGASHFPKAAAGLHLGAWVRKQHASKLGIPFPDMGMFIDRVLDGVLVAHCHSR